MYQAKLDRAPNAHYSDQISSEVGQQHNRHNTNIIELNHGVNEYKGLKDLIFQTFMYKKKFFFPPPIHLIKYSSHYLILTAVPAPPHHKDLE